MRVLALGNSHVGALLRGWTEIQGAHTEFTFSFAGALDEHLRDVTVEPHGVSNVGHRTEGSDRPLAEYAAFVVAADLPPPRRIFLR